MPPSCIRAIWMQSEASASVLTPTLFGIMMPSVRMVSPKM